MTDRSFTGIYLLQDGQFRFLNQSVASFAGYTPEELLGKDSLYCIHPDDREKARILTRCMVREGMNVPFEVRIIRKDGTVRWIMLTLNITEYKGRPAILGKIHIPSDILSKPATLSDVEYRLVQIHPEEGYEIIRNIDFAYPIAEVIFQHHERLDGSGYPRGLSGDRILQGALIIAVADVVEAMASHCPYRPTLGIDAAVEEIERNRGILYDRDVVDACLRMIREKGYSVLQ